MAEEWSDWFDHDRSGCPLPVGVMCHRIFDAPPDGGVASGRSGHIHPITDDEGPSWNGFYLAAQVVRYRYKRPPALLSLIDLAESVEHLRPETVKELVGV